MIEKLKIIYIAGHTRSGSTLLDRLLGQIEGVFSIGEARGAWDVFAEKWLCECGIPAINCPFWSEVLKEAFGKVSVSVFKQLKALQLSVSRIRHLPFLSFPSVGPDDFKRQYIEYLDHIDRFYKSIAKIADSRVIVDSSKNPAHALLLNSLPNVEVCVIHLVRDSRAVAFSWQRKRKRPEVAQGNAYQETYGPFLSALQWDWGNMATEWLRFFVHSYIRLRYEDLAMSPKETIQAIVDHFNLDNSRLDFFVDKHTVKIVPGHTIFGNPMRMQHGQINIKPDIEWQDQMKRSHRLIVTTFTFPLLIRYGYTLKRGKI